MLSHKCLCLDTQAYYRSPKTVEVCFPAGLSFSASMGEDSTVPINPEELKKQELALKIKQEYFSALKHEGMLLFGYLDWGLIVIPKIGSVIVKTSWKL